LGTSLDGGGTVNRVILGASMTLDGVVVKHTVNGTAFGAGLRVPVGAQMTVLQTQFTDCHGQYGGGIAVYGSLTARGLLLVGNSAIDGGGLFINAAGQTPTSVKDSVFATNNAPGYGGGLYVEDGSAVPVITDSVFTHNTASSHGNQVASSTNPTEAMVTQEVDLTDCSFDSDLAASSIYNFVGGGLHFENDVIWDNGTTFDPHDLPLAANIDHTASVSGIGSNPQTLDGSAGFGDPFDRFDNELFLDATSSTLTAGTPLPNATKRTVSQAGGNDTSAVSHGVHYALIDSFTVAPPSNGSVTFSYVLSPHAPVDANVFSCSIDSGVLASVTTQSGSVTVPYVAITTYTMTCVDGFTHSLSVTTP